MQQAIAIHFVILLYNVQLPLQKTNCCFSKLFGYYSCMTILPMLINLKNAVVVNYLVEVHIWSELVATLLASHYNHYILLNKHKKDGHILFFPC